MITHSRIAVGSPGLRRRALLGLLAVAALPVAVSPTTAWADAPAVAAIQAFNAALLAAMKSGRQTGFNQRYDTLAPVIDQTFDLRTVLAVSIGPGWSSLTPDQQNRLLDAFRRYTVASYVANFDSYSGQSFTVAPEPRAVGADRLVVQSQIAPADGAPTKLDYVMQATETGWKVVDVLAAGSISRVAVQRSDFRHILASGGGDALLSSLQRKTADLSGGAVA